MVYEPFPYPLIGFVNIAFGNHSIFQAGYVNWNSENFSGFQAAFTNTVGGDFKGFQAGFVNVNKYETKGMQVGFSNLSVRKMEGTQIGLVNIAARDMKGLQLGLINYAESINGVPVGLISIVKNGGYMAVEYFYSDYYNYNLSFKTGIEKFYTSINVSYNQTYENKLNNFASGMGIGSIFPLGKIFYFNPELTSLSPFIFNDTYESFVPYFGVNIWNCSIAVGPTITWVRKHNIDELDQPSWIRKYIVNENKSLKKPNYSLYYHEINDNNSISIGFRVAARVRF